jgi:hypothetical protein
MNISPEHVSTTKNKITAIINVTSLPMLLDILVFRPDHFKIFSLANSFALIAPSHYISGGVCNQTTTNLDNSASHRSTTGASEADLIVLFDVVATDDDDDICCGVHYFGTVVAKRKEPLDLSSSSSTISSFCFRSGEKKATPKFTDGFLKDFLGFVAIGVSTIFLLCLMRRSKLKDD